MLRSATLAGWRCDLGYKKDVPQNNMTDITITDFDLGGINARRCSGSAPVVLIIGSRGKGKSTIARALMRTLRNIPMGAVFSATEASSPFYSENVPSLFIYSTLDMKALEKIVKRQQMPDERKEVFILIDDMMYDPQFLRHATLKGIFLNGRHWGITLILTTQYAIDVPPALRGNVDYVFMMRENNIQTCNKLYKNFGGTFPTCTLFVQALKVCTQDFGSMVIDCVTDSVHRFRADIESEKEEFRMFAPCVWRYAKAHTCTPASERSVLMDGSYHRILMNK